MKENLFGIINHHDHVEQHKETLEIISNPQWLEIIQKGKAEVQMGIKGKSLDEIRQSIVQVRCSKSAKS